MGPRRGRRGLDGRRGWVGCRGAAALLTGLLLLHIAFAPSTLTSGGVPVDQSDGAVAASIELAFQAPSQSRPPWGKGARGVDKRPGNGARPVRLALYGTDALAIPVHLTRDEVRRAKEAEILAAGSWRQRSSRKGDPEVPESDLEGWTDGGNWGLRIVSLEPLQGASGDGKAAGRAFATRRAFLSPLVSNSTHSTENSEGRPSRPVTPDAYPIRLLPVQIPIETTRELAPTRDGALPGVVAAWSDGAVSLHVVAADVPPSAVGMAELELRQLWRTFPFELEVRDDHRRDGEAWQGRSVEFDDLALTFEPSAVLAGDGGTSDGGVGNHGAILVGGRYTLTADGHEHPLKVSHLAMESMTGLTTKLGWFPWDQIDPFLSGLCGMNKCFFRHVNSRDGLTVSYSKQDAEDQFLGWERGLALERDYGLKQPYYREHPPQKILIPGSVDGIQKKLKRHVNRASHWTHDIAPHLFIGIAYGGEEGTPVQRPNSTLHKHTPDNSLEVTQVRYIHKPHLEYPRRCRKQINEFNLAIQDRRGFADTLAGDIAKLEIALEKEPWLKNDFQVIIDTGGFVHLFDLTRPCVGSVCLCVFTSFSALTRIIENLQPCVGSVCSNKGTVGNILNGLRSLVLLAVSETENDNKKELTKACVPDGTFH
ncbi:hypothetical protein THAOC_14893 [Thalassiosira oceanica]|uniref:Uncharacterized protein n=1 Tax=Thalassiosira oceanica TaxID=159749 RepID=K0T1N5_THAOC|nr:hypothetical protein THAOC_14893 [Thalassiosira oceanica]|eukprot:EJK64377.1 hypothetical protein THAOC_14893 [Thalassiosira oceanica]